MSLPGVDEARARMLAHVAPLPIETVACEAALGRILREDVMAVRDQPPFAASAMDGWAVRDSDLGPGPADLRIVGESAAGRGWDGELAAGQAVRISTGAPLPEGADRIVMREEATRVGDRVYIGPLSGTSRFLRPRGADFAKGDRLLACSTRLDPWRLALIASAGLTTLKASARPRVVIVSTGDELASPGAAVGRWQIFDSAGPGLIAWFEARGCAVERHATLPDVRGVVAEALHNVDCDLLVTIGGASVGDHDVVKPALASLRLQMVVEGVAVRPGKPTWFGVLPPGNRAESRLVLGLPGNPVSAMVCAELFAVDVIAGLEGIRPHRAMRRARITSPLPANGPREHYMRAAIWTDAQGRLLAEAASDQDSSLVSVLASAGGLIQRLAGAPEASADDAVDVLLLDRAAARV